MAGGDGFEPSRRVPETRILPLDDPPKNKFTLSCYGPKLAPMGKESCKERFFEYTHHGHDRCIQGFVTHKSVKMGVIDEVCCSCW